ncbi:MAG: Stp1/IreP family PP2C-type Ser/Thr phosphatase [Rubrobacteraceae bacterium]
MLYLDHFGLTDAGKVRRNNEDSLLLGDGADETLFVVADGIGGFEAGEVASSMTVEVLRTLEPGEPFGDAIREANRRILAAARDDDKLSGMGTTVVALRFGGSSREPRAEVSHVGDSRAYLLRGGELSPLTEDHSLVAELVRSGDLTRAQAAQHPQKNLITRALGADAEVEADNMVLPVEAGDRLLLCSDGLSDMIREDRIHDILRGHPGEPETPARGLIAAALAAGGTDNVTVVVVDVKERSQPRHVRDTVSGTQEMQAVEAPNLETAPEQRAQGSPSTVGSETRTPRRQRETAARRRRRKRVGEFFGALAKLVRGIAILLAVAVILTPAYLWGSSRYYMGFDEGEIVLYQGIPYSVGSVDLNREAERTGTRESEVAETYQDPIEDHKLYTRDEVDRVLQDLGN